MEVPLVECIGMGRHFTQGDTTILALQSVDFSIHRGDFLAITGPSGSGKSTLMHLIGCLDKPTTGQLKIRGQDVTGLDDRGLSRLRSEAIGFVFQSFHLIPHLTIHENVALPLLYRGVARAERLARAADLLAQLGLSHRLDHTPSQLSGGQNQRAAIARALVNQPALILADEPTGNLDSATGREVLELFTELNEKQGTTLVIVTHDHEVAKWARGTCSIADGRVLEFIPPPRKFVE